MTNSTPNIPILDDDAVAEIEARANAATRGPWKQQFTSGKGYTVWTIADRGSMQVAVFGHAESFDRDNAELVAHARDDVPALCATVRVLRAENERLTTELRTMTAARDRLIGGRFIQS